MTIKLLDKNSVPARVISFATPFIISPVTELSVGVKGDTLPQPVPSYISPDCVSVLNLKLPDVGELGRCAVVPAGKSNAPVEVFASSDASDEFTVILSIAIVLYPKS